MTSSPSPSHWVESLFPPQYSIRDYRATFQPDHQRIRRYITTLSTFDAPTLAAIYEQSYLFTLIQRLAKQEEEEKIKSKTKTKANQTEPVDSVLDIRLIRAFLEKHKEKEEKIDQTENLWTSDEISIIRSAYMKVRDDCLRLKSENDYYREQLEVFKNKFNETNQILEKLQEEHLSLKKTHTRWTIRTNSSEQLLDEQRQENKELIEHIEKLTEQNEFYRRNHLQMQTNLLEKQSHIEQLEKKIDHYDETIKRECDRRIGLVEKRAQVDKDRFEIENTNLQTKLGKEQDLRRQNLLALDQLRKHIALANPQENEQALCDIKQIMPQTSHNLTVSNYTNKTIKCVCVGDGCVGKTSMLISYTTNTFPQSYVPTVFDNYSVTVMINNEPHTLALFDTAGQNGFELMRAFSYTNTDVFLVCFSVMSPASFNNALKVWINEIRQSSSSSCMAPFVLVGTKIDLRTNLADIELLAKSKQKPITREQGERAAKEHGAYGYVECSALTQENLKETFDAAILAALTPLPSKRVGILCCCS
ncbi:unnamed protein product [Rotaria sp. Silwood1]|nr:unnamed protein product [Rotaria sp. Silwood1]CAF4578468.1 unnamed protein product [Rotaria sp. Silwood1]